MMWPMSARAAWLFLALEAACATAPPSPTRDALGAEAARCESFERFDVAVAKEGDRLLASASGEVLVTKSAALSRARHACARHTLERLPAQASAGAWTTVQAELDALARAYPPRQLEALAREALGAEAPSLAPLLLEARAHAAAVPDATPPPVEVHAPQTLLGPEPTARPDDTLDALSRLLLGAPAGPPSPSAAGDDLTCAERPEPCARLDCLAAEHRREALVAAARACLDAVVGAPPDERAQKTSGVVRQLTPLGSSGALTEALVSLETLRRQRWPEVEAATQPGRAASLAEPFAVLPGWRAPVAAVRQRAATHHLELARTLTSTRPLAAWLHRALAARWTGREEAPPTSPPGRWAPPAWRCPWAAPTPPEAFPGAQLRLEARCLSAGAAPKPAAPQRKSELATFELEATLVKEALSGAVSASCSGATFREPLTVGGALVDGERAEALKLELDRVLPTLQERCRRAAVGRATEACATASSADGDLEERNVEAWLATGHWAPCFAARFEARFGTPPPTP